MRICGVCGGAVVGAGEVAGTVICRCMKPYPGVEKTPEEIRKQWDEFNKRHLERLPGEKEAVEEMALYMKQQAKGNVKKPSFSHILNLCEQLSAEELAALVSVLTTMVKK